jgi:hypothetical protein
MHFVKYSIGNVEVPMMDIDGKLCCTTPHLVKALNTTREQIEKTALAHTKEFSLGCTSTDDRL